MENKINIVDIIQRKQAGQELSTAEIRQVVREYTEGILPDYQVSALLMAIYFRGMSRRETADLVNAMADSGEKADLSRIPGIKVDKHSTGGVGDKVSLIVAPLVASLGVPVPMMSGRGLGHTGGTLDKLESIPGFRTNLTLAEFERQIAEIGCALIGQTETIAPADRKLYALRDVTATVGSIPLIAGSILSKKIAEGTDALLLDVKFGRGAIFSDLNDARQLAENLVEIGGELGLKILALLTDMDQPLGRAVGNWMEVVESLQILRGESITPDLLELCLAEAALMLMLGNKAEDYRTARNQAAEALKTGKALQKFFEIAAHQNADVSYLENPSRYPKPAVSRMILSRQSGYVAGINALVIGRAAVKLGAGRLRKEDVIDANAGIFLFRKRGEAVNAGEPLACLYASDEQRIDSVISDVGAAFAFSQSLPETRPLIVSQITRQGEKPWQS